MGVYEREVFVSGLIRQLSEAFHLNSPQIGDTQAEFVNTAFVLQVDRDAVEHCQNAGEGNTKHEPTEWS